MRNLRLALALSAVVLLTSASSAGASIYWLNDFQGLSTIGRAGVDGSSPNQSFIGSLNVDYAQACGGMAIDAAHLYWSDYTDSSSTATAVGRAAINGSGATSAFVNGGATMSCGVAVDGGHIYWADRTGHRIGRANLDGTSPNPNFITGASDPWGVAVDGSHIYWSNRALGEIGRANLNGTTPKQNFVTGLLSPHGVAVDGSHIYWANDVAGPPAGGSIGRANIDGSGANNNFITGANRPHGVAIDAAHIYWANWGTGSIGRANLSGSAPTQTLVTNGNAPAGITVDPSPPVVTTGLANGVTQTTATLTGTVDPQRDAVTNCHFDYGTTASYGTSVACSHSPANLIGAQAVSAPLGSLTPGVKYFFRLVATTAAGTTNGTAQSFTSGSQPPPPAPLVTTDAPGPVGSTSATLQGTVDPRGSTLSDCHFEYGESASYGSVAPCAAPPSELFGAQPASATVGDLAPSTTYHYRLLAANAGGAGPGTDRAFTTPELAITATEGAPFTAVVGHFASQPGSTTINWGDATASTHGTLSPGAGGFDVTASHVFAEEGSYRIVITAANGKQSHASATVADAPLIVAAPSPRFGGTDLSDGVDVAQLLDEDPNATPSDYVATIDWGDGSKSAGRIDRRFQNGKRVPGSFRVVGAHQYVSTTASDHVTVTVADSGGASDSATATGVFAPPPPPTRCPPANSPTGNAYDIGAPQAKLDENGHPTGAITQTLTYGLKGATDTFSMTAQDCWRFVGITDQLHQQLGALGPVVINGIWLTPVDPASSPELLVDTGGTVLATGSDTRYSVAIPDPDGYIQTVGQVDLGATAFHLEDNGHFGNFGPSPNGPMIGGRGIDGGEIIIPDRGAARLTAYLTLPSLFSSLPGSGAPPTATLNYDVSAAASSSGAGAVGGTICTTCPGAHHPVPHYTAPDRVARGRGLSARIAQAPSSKHFHLNVPDLYLGGLEIKNAFLDYDPDHDLWTGGGDLELGVASIKATPPPADLGFGIHGDGSFAYGGARGSWDPGIPIYPPVDLEGVGFSLGVDPIRFSGDVALNVADLVKIHGGFLAVFATPSHPWSYSKDALPGVDDLITDTHRNPITTPAFGAGGEVGLNLPVVGEVQLASGHIFYIYPGYLEAAGEFHYDFLGGALHLEAGFEGALSFANPLRYYFDGHANACADFPWPIGNQCAHGEAVLSSAGVGACVAVAGLDAYGRYEWHNGLTLGLEGASTDKDGNPVCDGLGPIKIDVRGAADVRAAAPPGMQLPPGLPFASVTVNGRGGAPRVSITGPHGERAVSDPDPTHMVKTRQIVIFPMSGAHQTMILVKHPRAGRWTIGPLAGSAPITGISHANGLAPPHISASVHGSGHRRVLRYRVRPRAGQSVVLGERSNGVFRVIGSARGASGSIPFKPAVRRAGLREIVAMISLSGVPNRNLVVAHYHAPPPLRAAKARHLRLRRVRGGVVARWGASANAQRYAAIVKVSDGRRLLFTASARRRSVTIRNLSRAAGVRLSVVGLGPDGKPGPSASAALAGQRPPARVTRITFKRTRNGVIVRWRRVAGALDYVVSIALGAGSARKYVVLTGPPRLGPSRILRALRRGQSARLQIRALAATGQLGAWGTARYSRH